MTPIRLTRINNIHPDYMKTMEILLEDYISLMERISFLSGDTQTSSGESRAVALAMTHLEQSSMYTQKALALMGEQSE